MAPAARKPTDRQLFALKMAQRRSIEREAKHMSWRVFVTYKAMGEDITNIVTRLMGKTKNRGRWLRWCWVVKRVLLTEEGEKILAAHQKKVDQSDTV